MVSFAEDGINGNRKGAAPYDDDDTGEAGVRATGGEATATDGMPLPKPPSSQSAGAGRQSAQTYPKGAADGVFSEPKAEFTTAFDIIDEMSTQLQEAKSGVFQPGIVKIDRDSFAGLLDELKNVLPVQLERASALMRESERRLENAQAQADSIIASARQQADETVAKANQQANFLAGRQNVIAIANDKARAILDTAQERANKLTQGADDYSAQVLASLQEQLEKLDRDVKGGLSVLRARQQDAASQLRPLTEEDYPRQS